MTSEDQPLPHAPSLTAYVVFGAGVVGVVAAIAADVVAFAVYLARCLGL
jgi:hypothetical protein